MQRADSRQKKYYSTLFMAAGAIAFFPQDANYDEYLLRTDPLSYIKIELAEVKASEYFEWTGRK